MEMKMQDAMHSLRRTASLQRMRRTVRRIVCSRKRRKRRLDGAAFLLPSHALGLRMKRWLERWKERGLPLVLALADAVQREE